MALDKRKSSLSNLSKIIQGHHWKWYWGFPWDYRKDPLSSQASVDMVWLNPFYPSPQRDNGYDISRIIWQ